MSSSQGSKATPIKYSEWIITDNDDSVCALNCESENLGRHLFLKIIRERIIAIYGTLFYFKRS